MSGSEKRLCPFEASILWCWNWGEGVTIEREEEEDAAEGGHEEKCNSKSRSVPLIYKDWVLSLRRLRCSRFLTECKNARRSGGVEVWAKFEAAAWDRTPGGSLTVSGMTGQRRCRRCLREALEDSEAEEAQLDREEVELAGVRFDRDVRPPGTLSRWAISDGLGGQTGLCLLSWWEPRPEREEGKTGG